MQEITPASQLDRFSAEGAERAQKHAVKCTELEGEKSRGLGWF